MKYTVRFRLQIHASVSSSSSDDVWLDKIVKLPIPPATGMEISCGNWSATISQIYLPIDERYPIQAFVEADKQIYNARLRNESGPTMEEIVKDYRAEGWRVSRR